MLGLVVVTILNKMTRVGFTEKDIVLQIFEENERGPLKYLGSNITGREEKQV